MARRRKAAERKRGSRGRQVNQGLRRSYDAAFKIKVINEAESSNNCQAAKKYGVTECNVRRWRAQKDSLKHANSRRKAFRGPKSGRFQEVERRVCEYVTETFNEETSVTRADIQLKALEVAEQLNIPAAKFEASLGWCKRMIRRNGLCLKRTRLWKQKSSALPQVEAAEKKPEGCLPVPVTDVSPSDGRDEATAGWMRCVLCCALEKKNWTVFKCRSCNVPLCINPYRLCFTEWHDLQKTGGLKTEIQPCQIDDLNDSK